jgi:hypothetical protein
MGTRYLEDGEKIIRKNAKINGARASIENELEKITIQKPNRKLLGFLPIAYLVHIHEYGVKRFDPDKYRKKLAAAQDKYERKIADAESEKRKTRLRNRLRHKTDKYEEKIREGNWFMGIGEELAVYDSLSHEETIFKFQQFLTSKGYLRGVVTSSVETIRKNQVRIDFLINTGPRYTIDSLRYTLTDFELDSLIQDNIDQSLFKIGMAYDQPTVEDERERLYELFTDNGYFAFSKQYLAFEVDTSTLGNHQVILNTIVRNPSQGDHKQYKVDSIIFLSESNLPQTSRTAPIQFNNISYQFGEQKYNPKLLDWRIFLEKDSLFNRSQTIETQRQLSFLDAYRFVNINFDSTASESLTATIFTSPMNRFQTAYELGFVQAAQQIPGPFINVGIKNRNTFGSLEVVQVNGNFSILGLDRVSEESPLAYTFFQYGGDISINFPQFLFPTGSKFKKRIGSYNPNTRLQVRYNFEDRTSEYRRTNLETSLSYFWQVEDNLRYRLTPLSINFIDVTDITDTFSDFLVNQEQQGNGALAAAFQSSLITSTAAELLINSNSYGLTNRNSNFFRIFLEFGGTLNYFVDDLVRNDSTLFSWAKVNFDFRSILSVDSKRNLAYRINLGVAYPNYDRNLSLPYDKRFYAGGSNSIRAWQFRRLGPGAYGIERSTYASNPILQETQYALEQGGDMILETSIEYRRKLFGFVDYAAFIDAGNIWITNSNQRLRDAEGDDGRFKFNSFLNEIAVGAGLGIRLDFSFLIFRLDGAVQVVDPAQVLGERYILDDINILAPFNGTSEERAFFRNKTNLNLGIGFPF